MRCKHSERRERPRVGYFLYRKADGIGHPQQAKAVFDNPNVEPEFEPDDVASTRAAVERLESRFASVPGTFTALLEGARDGAELLSGDRLQGLSEIIQNADDVGATEVHFLLQPDALLIAHDGRPVRLRDVLALATSWVTTKRHDSEAVGRFGIGLVDPPSTLHHTRPPFRPVRRSFRRLHRHSNRTLFGPPWFRQCRRHHLSECHLSASMPDSEILSEWPKSGMTQHCCFVRASAE